MCVFISGCNFPPSDFMIYWP